MESVTTPSRDELYPAVLTADQYEHPFVAATALVVFFLCACMFLWRRFFGCKTLLGSFDLFAFSWVVGQGKSIYSRPTVIGLLATLCVFPLGALLSYFLWLSDVDSRQLQTLFETTGELSSFRWEFNLTISSNRNLVAPGDCETLLTGALFHGFNSTGIIKRSAISGEFCASSLYLEKVIRTNTIGVRSISLDFPFSSQEFIVELRSWSPFLRKEYTQRILVNASSEEYFLQGPTVITFLAQPLNITTADSVSHSGVEFSFQTLHRNELPRAEGFIIGNTSNVQLQVCADSVASAKLI